MVSSVCGLEVPLNSRNLNKLAVCPKNVQVKVSSKDASMVSSHRLDYKLLYETLKNLTPVLMSRFYLESLIVCSLKHISKLYVSNCTVYSSHKGFPESLYHNITLRMKFMYFSPIEHRTFICFKIGANQ